MPDAIFDAAMAIAETDGWRALTRDRVAERAGVGQGSVNTHYGTIEALKSAVMVEAVRRQMVAVIAHGLVEQHPAAIAAPPELKRRALEMLV